MTKVLYILLTILFVTAGNFQIFSQGFLKTQGKAIVNESGDTVILRGMGLGGWMLQEGYMLQTAEFANPQYQIEAKIEDLIGQEAKDAFYDAWLKNHMTKADVDSLKLWGFNHVRLPMHYKLYTLPIEDEPIAGQNTWLEKGFALTDSLISWCAANDMYVILDLHAAPGGQGYDQGISDYDPSKPSLWESEANKKKTVDLWRKLAERYVDEPWIGGYDLLNEPNWDMPGNQPLRALYNDITEAIRAIDQNHIIIIEGNWFANDFTGLTPPWDDNMVYGPHKYWSFNETEDIQWVLTMRDQYDIPLYFGETGENSNTWFRDANALFESEGIGYAWWPLKKIESIAGILSINKSPEYTTLLNYWKGIGSKPTVAFATDALMALTEDLKVENCKLQKDVVDALFRQVNSDASVAFKQHSIPGKINAADFDMGRVGIAYHDTDIANYNVSTGVYSTWNNGWAYRNDGVDIQPSNDIFSDIRHNVGWIENGEWMKYSLSSAIDGVYDIKVRLATGGTAGRFHFSMTEVDLFPLYYVPVTGGDQIWMDVTIQNIPISSQDDYLKFHADGSGFNVSSFEFIKVAELSSIPTEYVTAKAIDFSSIEVHLNKALDQEITPISSDFEIYVNGNQIPVVEAYFDDVSTRLIHLNVDYLFSSDEEIQVSYKGSNLFSQDGSELNTFLFKEVQNLLPEIHTIPGRIQAEDFSTQNGVIVGNSNDPEGGGQMLEFINGGDFATYLVKVETEGVYDIVYRTAAESNTGGLEFQVLNENDTPITKHTVSFAPTGSWTEWRTTTKSVYLDKGQYTIRMLFTESDFNMNWMDFTFITSNKVLDNSTSYKVVPNPFTQELHVQLDGNIKDNYWFKLVNAEGKVMLTRSLLNVGEQQKIAIGNIPSGMYFGIIGNDEGTLTTSKLIKH